LATSQKYGVPFLGEIPLDVSIRHGGDEGKPVVLRDVESPAGKAFTQVSCNVAAQVSIANLNNLNTMIIQ
jgi:ATP-binding protein involved in chromosome partitioning